MMRYFIMKISFAVAKACLRLVCRVCYEKSEIKYQSEQIIESIDYTLRIVP